MWIFKKKKTTTQYKFVIVKSYFGLGGDLCVLLGALAYAHDNGRTLVVDWDGGLYGSSLKRTVFAELFSLPHFNSMDSVPRNIKSIGPTYWKEYLFHPPRTYAQGISLSRSRPEDLSLSDSEAECVVITRDSIWLKSRFQYICTLAAQLKPVKEIAETVNSFTNEFANYKAVIGVHFRHGNGERKVIPPDPLWFRNEISCYLKTRSLLVEDVLVFVASDCAAVVDSFKKYYNCTSLVKDYIANGQGALHIDRKDLSDNNKVILAKEALTDMYILAKTDLFLGSGGFFSKYVRILRRGLNSKMYSGVRAFNNYDFNRNYYLAEKDLQIKTYLESHNHPLDGIFVKIHNTNREIYFMDKLVYVLPIRLNKISSIEGLNLRKNIVRYRLY
ncbi:MAG: nodulation protein NodZ [Burkholderiales bacterium]|nr:nodulation protein NodZ [Burkholderiales bacterium]